MHIEDKQMERQKHFLHKGFILKVSQQLKGHDTLDRWWTFNVKHLQKLMEA